MQQLKLLLRAVIVGYIAVQAYENHFDLVWEWGTVLLVGLFLCSFFRGVR